MLSPTRITLEYNGKIRLQPDGENAFARASGGWGGIRTHGCLHIGGFQDRRNRPLCHPSVAGRRGRRAQRHSVPSAGLRAWEGCADLCPREMARRGRAPFPRWRAEDMMAQWATPRLRGGRGTRGGDRAGSGRHGGIDAASGRGDGRRCCVDRPSPVCGELCPGRRPHRDGGGRWPPPTDHRPQPEDADAEPPDPEPEPAGRSTGAGL